MFPVSLPEGWADVAAIVMVGRERTIAGVTTNSTHHYMTSLNAPAKKLDELIRKHWSVENQVHWSLDVTFREDSNRTRQKHACENLGLIRRIALSLIKQDAGTGALKGKRQRAGWNLEYLAKNLS